MKLTKLLYLLLILLAPLSGRGDDAGLLTTDAESIGPLETINITYRSIEEIAEWITHHVL